MVSQPVMVTIVTARCIPLQLALGSVCHLRGNSYPCTCKNQFGWGSIFVHPKKKLYHAHGRSLLVSSPAVCTQKRVSVLLGIVYYPTSCSVLVWLIPSLIPNPAPFPTGRVISGGDEEDPDHAGNPGERIWEGTTPHTAHTVRDSTCSVAGTRQVKSCNNMYLCVCVCLCFFSVQVCDCDDGAASVHHWRRVWGQPEGLWTTARYLLLLLLTQPLLYLM